MVTLLIFEEEENLYFFNLFFFIFIECSLLGCSFLRTLLAFFYLVHSETVASQGLYRGPSVL